MVLNLGSLQNSHEGRISCLGLSADGSALCTGSWDTNLKVSMHFGLIQKFRAYVLHIRGVSIFGVRFYVLLFKSLEIFIG